MANKLLVLLFAFGLQNGDWKMKKNRKKPPVCGAPPYTRSQPCFEQTKKSCLSKQTKTTSINKNCMNQNNLSWKIMVLY